MGLFDYQILEISLQYWYFGFIFMVVIVSIGAKLVTQIQSYLIHRSLKNSRTIISEYQTPRTITPGAMGYLIDGNCDDRELMAMIISLKQHGFAEVIIKNDDLYIKIVHIDKMGTNVPESLRVLARIIHNNKTNTISWNSISSESSEVLGIHNQCKLAIIDELSDHHLLRKSTILQTLKERKKYAVLTSLLLSIIFVGLPLFAWIPSTNNIYTEPGFSSVDSVITIMLLVPFLVICWYAFYAYIQLLFFYYYKNTGLPIGSTEELRRLWHDFAGYRYYLEVVEFNRLSIDKNINDPLLPWCIALGMPFNYKEYDQKHTH